MAGFSRVVATVLVLFITVGGWSSDMMAAAAPPLPDCTSVLVTLQGCLPYVTGGSASPTSDCCSGVLDVHLTDPTCLCVLNLNDSTTQIIPDYKLGLARQLPTLCNIQGASASNCPALLGETNATSPAAVPVSSNPAPGDTGGARSLHTSTNLRASIFTYLGIVLAASALFSVM